MTGFDRLYGGRGRGWGAILLFVEVFIIIGCHGEWLVVVVYDSSVESMRTRRTRVEGSEDKDATSNFTYIIEVEGQDKGKKVVSISEMGGTPGSGPTRPRLVLRFMSKLHARGRCPRCQEEGMTYVKLLA